MQESQGNFPIRCPSCPWPGAEVATCREGARRAAPGVGPAAKQHPYPEVCSVEEHAHGRGLGDDGFQ